MSPKAGRRRKAAVFHTPGGTFGMSEAVLWYVRQFPGVIRPQIARGLVAYTDAPFEQVRYGVYYAVGCTLSYPATRRLRMDEHGCIYPLDPASHTPEPAAGKPRGTVTEGEWRI